MPHPWLQRYRIFSKQAAHHSSLSLTQFINSNQSIVGVRIEKSSLSLDKLVFSLINPFYQHFTHLTCHIQGSLAVTSSVLGLPSSAGSHRRVREGFRIWSASYYVWSRGLGLYKAIDSLVWGVNIRKHQLFIKMKRTAHGVDILLFPYYRSGKYLCIDVINMLGR